MTLCSLQAGGLVRFGRRRAVLITSLTRSPPAALLFHSFQSALLKVPILSECVGTERMNFWEKTPERNALRGSKTLFERDWKDPIRN